MDSVHVGPFDWFDTEAVIHHLSRTHALTVDPERRGLLARRADHPTLLLVPPLMQPVPEPCVDVAQFLASLEHTHRDLVLLLQAGAAALATIQEGEIVEHKCVKAYMVRKKQGKSQLTYLKTKGKSRAGSRLRLRNATRFLDDVSARLDAWWSAAACRSIFFSVPVRLRHELFNADPAPPLAWPDPRWVRIPLHVNVPSFNELQQIVAALHRGELRELPSDDGLNTV